jgi:chorismate mutase
VGVMPELDALRTRIDTIDEQIIRLLADRFRVTEEVGLLKKRYQLQAIDPVRRHRMTRRNGLRIISARKATRHEKGIG